MAYSATLCPKLLQFDFGESSATVFSYHFSRSHIDLMDRGYSTRSDFIGKMMASDTNMNVNRICKINEFEYAGKKFVFKSEISLLFVYEDGFYSLDYEPFDIHIAEETIDEAITSFYEEIDMLWSEYVLEDESILSIDAKKLKASILERVKEVRIK